MSEVVVQVKNLSKMYRLYEKALDRVKEFLLPGNRSYHREFYAVRDLSFEVHRGEVMGIVGVNGSGKSTLLKMITGVLTPTSGNIEVKGRIAALLELGAGFNPEFTGLQNIYLQGSIMGYSREEMEQRLDEIIAFADIGDFIHQPVKTYSSGMFVRLAFAVNSCVEPDVLIVDEALSVGDFYFVQKCYRKIEETIKKGTAVIFVTHNMGDMVKFCNKAILLSHGRMLYQDDPLFIMQKYLSMQRNGSGDYTPAIDGTTAQEDEAVEEAGKIEDWPELELFQRVNAEAVEGNGCLECCGVALLNTQGLITNTFQMGEQADFYYEYRVLKNMEVPIFGIDIVDSHNNIVHGKQSLQCGLVSDACRALPAGTMIRCKQSIRMNLAVGTYTTVIGMSMLPQMYYELAGSLSYSELCGHMERVISISKAIMFNVIEADQGLAVPFHGMCDLPGNCELHILPGCSREDLL